MALEHTGIQLWDLLVLWGSGLSAVTDLSLPMREDVELHVFGGTSSVLSFWCFTGYLRRSRAVTQRADKQTVIFMVWCLGIGGQSVLSMLCLLPKSREPVNRLWWQSGVWVLEERMSICLSTSVSIHPHLSLFVYISFLFVHVFLPIVLIVSVVMGNLIQTWPDYHLEKKWLKSHSSP